MSAPSSRAWGGCSVGVEGVRQPLQGYLVALVRAAAVVSAVLDVLVGDPGVREVVAEEPVAPVEVVVVVEAGIEQDPRQLPEIVEMFPSIGPSGASGQMLSKYL